MIWRVVRAGRRSTTGNRVVGKRLLEGSNPLLSAKARPPFGRSFALAEKRVFEPFRLERKQNSPVNCFVAKGGEAGTEREALGGKPRDLKKRESLALRQKPHCYKA